MEYLQGLLSDEQMSDARNRAIFQGLGALGAQLSKAGAPSLMPQGSGFAEGLAGFNQAYQGSFDTTLQNIAKGAQIREALRKQQEAEQIRKIYQSGITPRVSQAIVPEGQTLRDDQGQLTMGAQPSQVTGFDVDYSKVVPALQAMGSAGIAELQNLAKTQQEIRKAGLGKPQGQDLENPFLPWTTSSNPNIRTLAQQYAQGYQSGRITDEKADNLTKTLATMDTNAQNQQVYQQLNELRINQLIEKQNQVKDGRPLPPNAINQISTQSDSVSQLKRLKDNAKDSYFGFGFDTIGEAAIAVRQRSDKPEMVEFSQWWQDYQTYKNKMRNDLFGSALTATEKNEFEKAVVTPKMSATQAKANLKRQADAAETAFNKLATAYEKAGYSKSTIESLRPVSIGDVGGVTGIPDGAINMLIQNPSLAPQFDAKYGAGASKRVLGK